MKQPTQLNLLIIDDNQLYAEALVDVLEQHFYQKVSLGFLDDKEELLKLLRQSWDVLVMGKAYDLTLPQVVTLLKEQSLDIPVVAIIPEGEGLASLPTPNAKEQAKIDMVQEGDGTDPALPLLVHWGAVDALPKERLVEMALRIYYEHCQKLVRQDLTQLRNVLSDAEQRANILIKNSKSAVAYIEDGLHIFANDPYLEMFGFKSLDDLRGVPVVDLVASNNIKDFKQFLKDFEKGNRSNVEFKFESVRTDGSTFAAKLQLAAATYEGQPCQQVIIQPNESANSAELAKKLAALERIDPLTGIVNRRGFEEVLASVYDATVKQGLSTGLLVVRIDGMGKLNSSLGVQGLDSVVIGISQLLKTQLSGLISEESVKKGLLSRFSDSHFMLIIPNIQQADLVAWGEQLVATMADTLFQVGQRSVKVTVTVGATLINASSPATDVLVDRVMQAVSLALQDTNNEGNTFYLYDPASFADSDDSALLESLRTALEQGKFTLLYQPIYDIEQDASNLFEVFLRLPLADGTLMSPDKFMDVAEQHGLMDKIDRWVLIRAAKDLKRYRSEVDGTARLLVHLSYRSLMDQTLPAFVGQLSQAIGSGVAGTLTVQFNENMIGDYLAVAAQQTEQLKHLGCHVGIYNFGSSVNAMEMLEYVKPNLVRLDRSYIKDLGNSENVNTITTLVKEVNARETSCLMAFIEDPATMSAAWTIGARYLQGNYLQAPSETMHIQTEQA